MTTSLSATCQVEMAAKKEVVQTIGVLGLTAVLAGVLFAGRLNGVGLFKPPSSGNVTRPQEPVAGGQKPEASPPGTRSNTSRYTANILRDPLKSFLPPPPLPSLQPTPPKSGTTGTAPSAAPRRPPLPRLDVQGVVWGGLHPQAIINNRIYRVGDTISGGKIIEINRRGVGLDFGGARTFFSPSPASKSSKGQPGGQN